MAVMILVGRLGRDAETKDFGGKTCIKFSVAYDTGYGEKKKTTWVNCSWWGDRAAKVAQYLQKGTMVEVLGEPSVRAYDKDGTPQASLDLNVSDLKLHGGGGDRKGGAPSSKSEDEIPF